MKRWLVVLFVAVLALAFAAPALAGVQTSHGLRCDISKFRLSGTVVSVNVTAASMVVKVKCGSRPVRPWRGKELTVRVPPRARIIGRVDRKLVRLTLSDIVAGCRVHVYGHVHRTQKADPVFVAKRVNVRPPRPYTID